MEVSSLRKLIWHVTVIEFQRHFTLNPLLMARYWPVTKGKVGGSVGRETPVGRASDSMMAPT